MQSFRLCIFLFLALSSCKSNETATPDSSSSINKPKAPGYLCIYYGYPSLINNVQGDLSKASDEFGKFNLIILGDGLWQTTHPDFANSKTIIENLIAKQRLVFGYVDLAGNTAETVLRQQIDGWKAMGASGVFFDRAGSDFKVTRERQNVAIQYCRQVSMKVFMNSFNPDDVLADPNCLMNENDFYMAESYLVGHDNYFGLDAWKKKADACYTYMKTKGVKIVCVASGGEAISANFNTTDKFSLAWCGTAMYNFSYFQATNYLYSANNNIVYFFPNLSDNFGSAFKQTDIVKDTDTHYYRSTDINTLHVYGNGSSQGYGKITNP